MVRRKKKSFFDKINREELKLVEAPCEHFGNCGGCSLQDISYDDQINIKKTYLKQLFGKEIDILPANKQYNYRNRMDFVYAFGKLGLRKKGNFKEVVEINKCHLIPEQFQELFQKVKSALKEQNIPSYDFLEHKGFLRYISFRYAPLNNEVMVFFSSKTPSEEEEKKLKQLISNIEKDATSIYWQINDSLTDSSIFPDKEIYFQTGKKYLTETIGKTQLSYSPFSFFQNNSSMAETVFEDIKKEVHGEVMDICCGVGSIALFTAEKAKSITGIEMVEEAIKYANKNKEENKIFNTTFFTSDMKKLLDYAPLKVDIMIIDPPRAGLGNKVIRKVLELSPEKIAYMSCNPKTQKIDFEGLKDHYEISSIKGYDLFPNTPHLETLLILIKK